MRKQMVIWTLAILIAVLATEASAALGMFEDWQGGTIGQNVNGYNGWVGLNRSDDGPWNGNTTAYIADGGSGNQAARISSPTWQSRGFRKGLGGSAVADGSTGTFYFRFKADSVTAVNHRFSLTNVNAPDNTGQEIVSLLLESVDATYFRVSGLNLLSYSPLKSDLVVDTWYSVWLVINQSSDTYDVYLTTGGLPTEADRIGSGLGFRTALAEPLDTFYAWSGRMGSINSAQVFVDDLAVSPIGASLSLPAQPASNPMPANNAPFEGTFNGVNADVAFGWDTAVDPNNPSVPNPSVTGHYLYIRIGEPNFVDVTPYQIPAGSPVQPAASYGPVALSMDTTYYWRVDESINGSLPSDANCITGTTWKFTTISANPVINLQPENVLLDSAGNPALFSISVTSLTPEMYFWYKSADNVNDTPADDIQVGSNLNTYSISAAELADQGFYFCKVVNATGQSLSNVVRLGIKRLAAHWTLDQAKFIGGQYLDETGSFPAAPANPAAAAFVAGPYALGSTSAVPVNADTFATASGLLDPTLYTNQLTVSAWIRLTSQLADSDGYGIVCKRGEDSSRWMFYARGRGANSGANSVRLLVYGGVDAWTTAGSIPLNEWVHVVATIEAASGACYINGVQNGYTSASTVFGTGSAAPVLIGRWSPTGNLFPGEIDDVRIYNYGMDKYGVAQLYAADSGKSVCIDSYQGTFDYNHDCKVDLKDFALMSSQWLSCGLYPVCP